MNSKEFIKRINESNEEFEILKEEWLLCKQDLYTLLGAWNSIGTSDQGLNNTTGSPFTRYSSPLSREENLITQDDMIMRIKDNKEEYTNKYYEIKEFKCSIVQFIYNNSDTCIDNYNQTNILISNIERFIYMIEEDFQLMEKISDSFNGQLSQDTTQLYMMLLKTGHSS